MLEDQEQAELRDVAAVEVLLDRFATRDPAVARHPSELPHVSLAAWFCACVSWSDGPVWLIHTTGDGVAWCRLEQGIEADHVIDAELMTGAHVAPSQVLAWLETGTVPEDVDEQATVAALRSAMLL